MLFSCWAALWLQSYICLSTTAARVFVLLHNLNSTNGHPWLPVVWWLLPLPVCYRSWHKPWYHLLQASQKIRLLTTLTGLSLCFPCKVHFFPQVDISHHQNSCRCQWCCCAGFVTEMKEFCCFDQPSFLSLTHVGKKLATSEGWVEDCYYLGSSNTECEQIR